MNVLGFDTATAATAVALLTSDGAVVEARDDPAAGDRPRHATALLPLAAGLLDGAALDWPALDLIAVGIGPGTFTGLRIGIATARALAQGSGAELVGISSLRALAAGAASESPRRPVAAMIDARRGELFVAAYAGAQQLLEPQALKPEQVGAALDPVAPPAADPWLAVGDGALRFRSVLEAAGVAVAPDDSGLHRLSAAVICRLAAAGQADAHEPVTPHYVRLPDAELTRRSADQ
jgi:tRNA threonylcarbamoyladenosine biosynthesis protein TsaB